MYNIHVKYIQLTLYIPKGSQLSSLPGKHLYDCCLTCRMNAISVAVKYATCLNSYKCTADMTSRVTLGSLACMDTEPSPVLL